MRPDVLRRARRPRKPRFDSWRTLLPVLLLLFAAVLFSFWLEEPDDPPAAPPPKPRPTVVVPPGPAAPEPTPVTGCPEGCREPRPGCEIKGNFRKEKIYHLPGQRWYDETKIDPGQGERWFCTEEEAVANGWRKAKV